MKTKQLMSITLVFICAIFLVACSTKNPDSTPPTHEGEKNKTGNPVKEESHKDSYHDYGFTYFEVDISTNGENRHIHAKYEYVADKLNAEYKTLKEAAEYSGDEAMMKLDPVFKKLSITYDTPEQDVIKQVTKAFDVSDYEVVDLKIQFLDHPVKAYKFEQKK